MKFEDVYSRRTADKLTQEQAAEILGVSVRTVRRWEDRFEADGAEGLYDRRLGKLANNRVPTDTVMEMLTLFDSKYWDYTPKHFHEKLVGTPWLHPKLQLATSDAAKPWPDPARPPTWSSSPQAAPPPDGWRDAASGRVQS
ncbi:helix-turn-helix domain-containing protein [Tateyamaria sp.]|uniref:helix-turn-helix domain-containing protein n=1 Tax=Tateyamaria sp. TaxID=1929288 RepID=UPI003B2178F5